MSKNIYLYAKKIFDQTYKNSKTQNDAIITRFALYLSNIFLSNTRF